MIAEIGDRLMFETDFPHPTSLIPDVQCHLAEALSPNPYPVRQMVFGQNLNQLCKLPY